MKEHNSNWSQVSDHPYRIFIARGSGSGKVNLLFPLFYYGNSKQKRVSTNSNLIIDQALTLETLLIFIKNVLKTILI